MTVKLALVSFKRVMLMRFLLVEKRIETGPLATARIMSTGTTTLDYVARGLCLLQSSQCINSIVNTQGGMCHLDIR